MLVLLPTLWLIVAGLRGGRGAAPPVQTATR
jgi:hypothetical protein